MISRIHYITQDNIEGKSHAQLATDACKGGIDWVQLRVKSQNHDYWKTQALETQSICKKYKAKFIINDNPILAKELKADGVHLGKTDMPVDDARQILGNKMIIGGTANNIDDVKRLLETSVDYIGLGPYRFTTTKKNLSPVLTAADYISIFELIKQHHRQIPVIGIGGITINDLSDVFAKGFYGIAIASTISLATDAQQVANNFVSYTKSHFEI